MTAYSSICVGAVSGLYIVSFKGESVYISLLLKALIATANVMDRPGAQLVRSDTGYHIKKM